MAQPQPPDAAPSASGPSAPAAPDEIKAAFAAEMDNMTAQAAATSAAASTGAAPTAAKSHDAKSHDAKSDEAGPGKQILEPIASSASARASRDEIDDMTRQLQEALKRPFSGVKPSPQARLEPAKAEDAPSAPALDTPQSPVPVAPSVRIGASEPAAPPPPFPSAPSAPPPPAAPAPAASEPRRMEGLKAAAAARAKSVEPALNTPGTAVAEPAEPAPEPASPELETTSDNPDGNKARPAEPEAASDPFSFDAIEAEFARLLNRGAPPRT